MAMNSVITNAGALVALQSLNRTNDQLAISQKRVSTGLRVADAKDDGAAFAVAQKVRGDMAGVTSANEQLGGAKGLLDTTLAGLNKISATLQDVKVVAVKLADDKVTGDERKSYEDQYSKLANQISQYVADSTYNGKSLLGKTGSSIDGAGIAAVNIKVVRNERGDTYTITGQNDGDFDLTDVTTVNGGATDDATKAANWKKVLDTATAGAKDFAKVEQGVNVALNQYGNDSKAVDNQISFNKDKLDALESGLGALIDADLAKESARMQSLQIRQQLGTTALSTANQAPQSLLSLFR